jgi:ferredoxin
LSIMPAQITPPPQIRAHRISKQYHREDIQTSIGCLGKAFCLTCHYYRCGQYWNKWFE